MAGGAWRASKTVDAVLTTGAGILLLAVAWDDDYPRRTVHVRADDGNIITTCPTSDGRLTYDFRSEAEDRCYRACLSRTHTMWSRVAALGMAAGRLL